MAPVVEARLDLAIEHAEQLRKKLMELAHAYDAALTEIESLEHLLFNISDRNIEVNRGYDLEWENYLRLANNAPNN